MKKISVLSGNQIKILACVLMLIDHIGYFLLPKLLILRIIGRVCFPLFAFMISEGARYTKNKIRYVSTIFVLGLICQIPSFVMEGNRKFNVLITFTLTILTVYALEYFKDSILNNEDIIKKAFKGFVFCFAVMAIYGISYLPLGISFEYGFFGCMIGVFASIPVRNTRLDKIWVRVLFSFVPLIAYCYLTKGITYYALLSLPILLLYSGKRGKTKMKYFFYVFYPTHVLILYFISALIL